MAGKAIPGKLKHSGGAVIEPLGAARPFATEAAAVPSLGMGNPISVLASAPWPEGPWWRRVSPSTLFVLLSVAVAVFFLLHELVIAKALGFPAGESWVRMVYARNFFHHLEFEYTPNMPGARPTSPFWIVVLSLAVNIFADPLLAAKLLGSIFLFFTGYYAFRLLRTVKLDFASALLGGVLIITSSALAWAELSGLESTLSTALVVGGLWWHFGPPNKISRTFQVFVTGAMFALGALTRPEITILLLLLALWQARSHEDRPIWKAFLMLSGFVLILAPVATTNIAVGGSLVPATFRSALGEKSVVLLAWHGHLSGILSQLFFSLGGIWAVTRDVYFAENPVWAFTILWALWARWKNPLIERDLADRLFSVLVLLLLAFPYFRTLILGQSDTFGEYTRLVHFLIPLYALAGLLSLRTLARVELFRNISPKQMIVGLAIALVTAGCAYLLVFEPSIASPIKPIIECVLLIFFTWLLLLAGLRHTDLPLRAREQPHFVTEQSRVEMKLSIHEDEEDPHLSAPAMAVFNATLLIVLAWNLAILPRAANDYGAEVRQVNQYRRTTISLLQEGTPNLWLSEQVRSFERRDLAQAGNMFEHIDANSRKPKL